MTERVKTRDIKGTLEEFSSQLGLPPEELDFEIISMELVGPENGRFFLEAEIEVGIKVPGLITIFDCLVEVDEKLQQSAAYVKVLPTFRMHISSEQLEKAEESLILTPAQKKELIKETKKLLLKEGIIYGHLPDEKIIGGWEKALVFIYKAKKPFSFKAAEGKPPKDPYRREIYYIPLVTPAGKVINERTGRINFKDRGYTDKKVLAGQKVVTVEYIPGEIGIKVTGEVIPFKEIDPLPFKVDEETLEVKEVKKEDKTLYDIIAKKDGYLFIENGLMGLSDYVKEKRVDYTTGNIIFEGTGVNIEVAAEGDRAVHDAVKDDFKLISPGKTVIIKGNVGRKAVVEGSNVVIEGTVAKDATVKADVCKINNTIGAKVIARKAFIDRSVNSNVDAEETFLQVVSGSTIRAKRVIALKSLKSSTFYAHDFICIEEGRDFNKFIINGLEVPQIRKQIEELEKEKAQLESQIKNVEAAIKKAKVHMDGQLNLLVSYMKPTLKENAIKLKPLIYKLLNDHKKLDETVKKLPKYARTVVEDVRMKHMEATKLLNEIKEKKKQIEEIEKRIEELKDTPAQVLILNILIQDNLIMFKDKKNYYTHTLKGPLLLYEEEGKVFEEKGWEEIGQKVKEHLDEDFLNLLRDYLLEKGLRTYITKMKL